MQVETWEIDRLLPYAGNPRKNDHAVEKMSVAIKEYGFRVPVLVKSSGDVIDGHLRIKAAKHAGLTDLPVIICDDMTDQQVKAFRLSVNKMAELAQWDFDLLTVELSELKEFDCDLSLTGFDLPEIDKLLDFELGDDGGSRRKEKEKPLIVCPKCGFKHE